MTLHQPFKVCRSPASGPPRFDSCDFAGFPAPVRGLGVFEHRSKMLFETILNSSKPQLRFRVTTEALTLMSEQQVENHETSHGRGT